MKPIPTPPIPCFQPEQGKPYWTVARWTIKGMRPEKTRWVGCMIDNSRKRKGLVFSDEKSAKAYLRNQLKD